MPFSVVVRADVVSLLFLFYSLLSPPARSRPPGLIVLVEATVNRLCTVCSAVKLASADLRDVSIPSFVSSHVQTAEPG